MKAVVRSKSLEKHTASLIFLHGSGEFQPLSACTVALLTYYPIQCEQTGAGIILQYALCRLLNVALHCTMHALSVYRCGEIIECHLYLCSGVFYMTTMFRIVVLIASFQGNIGSSQLPKRWLMSAKKRRKITKGATIRAKDVFRPSPRPAKHG